MTYVVLIHFIMLIDGNSYVFIKYELQGPNG
jgi:hypothetical protein